jgi:hypothetical protein
MNVENTKRLFDADPKLYRGRNMPITQNLMAFGFECGDGWFNILLALSVGIERLSRDMDDEQYPMAMQVKEKFGTLRFYIGAGSEAVCALIEMAEMLSAVTCDRCGGPGRECLKGGWCATLCEKCADEQGYEIDREGN